MVFSSSTDIFSVSYCFCQDTDTGIHCCHLHGRTFRHIFAGSRTTHIKGVGTARRSVFGLISRLEYHPSNSWTTLVPIDMLLLPQTPECYRKRLKNHRKKSQPSSEHSGKRRRHRRSTNPSSQEETSSYQSQISTSPGTGSLFEGHP